MTYLGNVLEYAFTKFLLSVYISTLVLEPNNVLYLQCIIGYKTIFNVRLISILLNISALLAVVENIGSHSFEETEKKSREELF